MGTLDKFKKNALQLYCLSDSDKNWIISRLDVSEKEIINKHLMSLEALSLPKDEQFISAAIEALDEKSEKQLYDILNRSVLVNINSVLDIFEREPSWIGACLKIEYPGLVNAYIVPKLSKIKLHEINNYIKDAHDQFTDKFKSTVFESVSENLKSNIPELNDEGKKIEFETALKRAV